MYQMKEEYLDLSYSESDDEKLINIKKNIKNVTRSKTKNITKASAAKKISKKTIKEVTKKGKAKKQAVTVTENNTDRESQEAEIVQLKNTLEMNESRLAALENDLELLHSKFSKVLTPDQICFISHMSCNKWSYQTILKSFTLFAACGPQGYEELKRQNLPYPSIETLKKISDHIEVF